MVVGYIHAVVKGGFSLFGVYLRCGQGLACDNSCTLSKLERAIAVCQGEWCATGDYDNAPEDLYEFAAAVGGVILKAPYPTCCAGGSESFIDFFIVSEGLASKVSGYWMDDHASMSPHRPWGLLFGGKER